LRWYEATRSTSFFEPRITAIRWCSFCGCNVIITQKPGIASEYVSQLEREVKLVASRLGGRTRLVQYHWGGGTPTYLSLEDIERVWRITRRQVTHNRYFESTDQLRMALASRFATWEQPNSALKVLCANI